MVKSIVYVDGFNLYYGALKGTKHKWLDIEKLVQFLLPKNQVTKIKYFTAKVNARPKDPEQPLRQQIYLRALATNPKIEFYYGHFLSHTVRLPLAKPSATKAYEDVIKTEEKGSDVNIATHLLYDGFKSNYEIPILISNDSDLVEPIKLLRNAFGKKVIILNPGREHPSVELRRYALFVKDIREGVLQASQYPIELTDNSGTFTKPKEWS